MPIDPQTNSLPCDFDRWKGDLFQAGRNLMRLSGEMLLAGSYPIGDKPWAVAERAWKVEQELRTIAGGIAADLARVPRETIAKWRKSSGLALPVERPGREQGLLAALSKTAEIEAKLGGIIGLLRRAYPELAPDFDNLESAHDGWRVSNRKDPHSRIPRKVRGRWEDRADDFFLLREGKILAIVHRDGEQWRALLGAVKSLGVYTDAAAGRKAVEAHLKVRPHPPEQK